MGQARLPRQHRRGEPLPGATAPFLFSHSGFGLAAANLADDQDSQTAEQAQYDLLALPNHPRPQRALGAKPLKRRRPPKISAYEKSRPMCHSDPEVGASSLYMAQ